MMMKPGACSKSRAWRVADCPLAASNKFLPPWPLLMCGRAQISVISNAAYPSGFHPKLSTDRASQVLIVADIAPCGLVGFGIF
jgi:hypothetical protein